MKQDIDTSTEQQKQADQPEKTTQQASPAVKKPAKNLYVPYSTPRILWEMIRYVARFIFFLTMRIRLQGRQNLPRKGPYILAANHLSWLDIPLVPVFIPDKVTFMAKEELFHGKSGWLVRFLGAFPVKRGEGDRQAIRAAEEQLKQGKIFMIFPEGTRSKVQQMAKGNAGLGMIAMRAGVPVVPVAIYGSENGLKKFGARITITYGEPITLKPKGAKITREDLAEGTDEVMRRIAAMLPERYRGVYA